MTTVANPSQTPQAPAAAQQQPMSIYQRLAALSDGAFSPLAAEALQLINTCDEMFAQTQERSVIGWERAYLITGLEYAQRRIEVILAELDLEAA